MATKKVTLVFFGGEKNMTPTDLIVVASLDASKVTFSWTTPAFALTPNAHQVGLYRDDDLIQQVSGSIQTLQDTALEEGGIYEYDLKYYWR